jgi:hypothetical protein
MHIFPFSTIPVKDVSYFPTCKSVMLINYNTTLYCKGRGRKETMAFIIVEVIIREVAQKRGV